jgi:transmembrane sensor
MSAAADTIRREAVAWLARRDAGLAPADARALAAWEAADPRHAAALAELAEAWRALDRPRSSGQAEWVRASLRQRARRRRRQSLGALAALVVVGFSLALWRPWAAAPGSAAGAATARVIAAERATLPDGSVAEFAPESRIEPRFDAAERRVRLVQGEVHFAVRKDAARPFVVEAGGVAVRAVGTAFAARLEPARVRVVVTEGTVAVGGTLVSAGNEISVATGNPPPAAPSALDPAAIAQRLAWRAPRLEFTETTLAEAAALFAAHAGPRLVPADAAVGALRVTGVFRADNAEGFVDLLERTLGVTAERTAGAIVLRAAPPKK